MWDAVKVLLLGKAVLLTPTPIDIVDQWIRIDPPAPLTAVATNAHIEIVITPSPTSPKSRATRIEYLSSIYNHGCVRATLITEKGKELRMKLKDVAADKKNDYLILEAPMQVPTSESFRQVLLRATCPLTKVTVQWRNDGKRPEGE